MEDKRICVVCPVCGAVDEYEVIDRWPLNELDETHFIEDYIGLCSNCRTELRWEQIYEVTCIRVYER